MRDDYGWVWIWVVYTVIVLAVIGLSLGDIDPKCESGHACVKCPCAGNYGRLIPEDEPDNPDNPKWPRHNYSNFCTRSCCLCTKAEA